MKKYISTLLALLAVPMMMAAQEKASTNSSRSSWT